MKRTYELVTNTRKTNRMLLSELTRQLRNAHYSVEVLQGTHYYQGFFYSTITVSHSVGNERPIIDEVTSFIGGRITVILEK